MAPPRLVRQLARDYGQTAVLGMPFIDAPTAENMRTEPSVGATVLPHSASAASAPSYWQFGGLWSVLATGEQTGGSYSLLEQALPQGPSAPPHVHAGMDEVFYILEGEATFLLDDRTEKVRAGAFLFISRGAVHAFRVDSPSIRLLNLYTPAGFERTLPLTGYPTEVRTMPARDLPHKQASPERIAALFHEIGMRTLAVPNPLT